MTDTLVDINNIVAPFKRDMRAKEVVNLDEDILPHEKNRERRNDQLGENLLGS